MDAALDNGYKIIALESSIKTGAGGISRVIGLVKMICKEGRWEEYRLPMTDDVRKPNSFEDFCKSELGITTDELDRLCKSDKEARDLIDDARKRSHEDQERDARGRFTGLYNVQDGPAPSGNRIEAALRRLRTQRPDLHARVLADELSPHAAMLEAGFRKRTATVQIDNPKSVASTLRKHMTEDALAELKELL